MRILMLSEPSYPLHPGGAGMSTHLLAAGLCGRGHQVEILCQSDSTTRTDLIDGVRVHRFRWHEREDLPRHAREAATAAQILAFIEQELDPASVDLLYDSSGFLSFFYPVAYRLKQAHALPYVLHLRYLLGRALAPHFAAPLSPAHLWLEQLVPDSSQGFPVRFADAVVCPSRVDARFVETMYRPPSPVHVIPEPVVASPSDPERVRALRERLAPAGEQLLLFAGRIDTPLKGGAIVARAFERLTAARAAGGQRPPRLVLLIKDESWLRPYQRSLEHITSLPWIRDRDELAHTLSAVDVVLMPSLYESFGMMCAEALAAGTPVVGSRTGGLADMIRPGENGFLLSASRPRAWDRELAELTLRILDQPELLRHMRAQARYTAGVSSAESVAMEVEAMCAPLVGGARSRAPLDLTPPRLSREDEALYFDLVERVLGSEALPMARAALAAWPAKAAVMCTSCTRSQLAQQGQGLIRLGRWRPKWFWTRLTGGWEAALTRALSDVCPLGLVQKARIRAAMSAGCDPFDPLGSAHADSPSPRD